MSVFPIPAPESGVAPFSAVSVGGGDPPPRARPMPNPYGIPDRVVLAGAERAAQHAPPDLRAAYAAMIGNDVGTAMDPTKPGGERLLHAGIAIGTILTLPGGPESLGLKLAAKETIRGGIEQTTYRAIGDAATNSGSVAVPDGAGLRPAEQKIAAQLAREGHAVVVKAPVTVGRSADFLVDGRPTELKTLSDARPNNATERLGKAIVDASRQAKNVIVDARDQRGLTEINVRRAAEAAMKLAPGRLSAVRVLGRSGKASFDVTIGRK